EAVLSAIAGVVTLLLAGGMLDYLRRPEENALFVIDALHLPVQRWWLLAIMPVGLVLIAYRFLLRSLEGLLLTHEQWHALERQPPQPPPGPDEPGKPGEAKGRS